MDKNSSELDLSLLKEENRRLKRGLEELSVLNEIATAINSALSIDNILESITQKCRKHLKVEQVAVMLLDEQSEEKPFQTMVRGWDQVTGAIPFRFDTQLTGWMLKNRTPLLINDFLNDNRFQKTSEDTDSIKSLLSVPLLCKSKMIGLITVFNKTVEAGFNDDDQRLLSIISSQSSQVIENARLLKEEQELIKVQQELQLAYEIQTNLLPEKSPEIDGYEIYGISIPAKEVGGDYFDFIPIENNKLAFCLGDISGKGMPAALLMSNLQASVRGQTLEKSSVKICMEKINSMLFHNTPPEKFSTFFYGILDSENHKIAYSNAGHNYPFLFSKKGNIKQLDEGDIVLGCMENFQFGEQMIFMEAGDLLLIYSDGITEAINENEEELGEDEMIKVIVENPDLSLEDMADKIMEKVKLHSGDNLQYDDMTIVLIKRRK
ncbi:MAG: SpoIIE family protein phosphatase [Candidatus Aminicenantes bacterium]|nr:SpoIIE family protein phosphatase [Candidatus Aminicenantes bacterium]